MGPINLALVVLMVIISVTNGREYLKFDGNAYYISYPEEKYNWYKAYQYCAMLGMHLIDINTDAEHKRFMRLLTTFNAKYKNEALYYWMSGTDLGSNGYYYWMPSGQYIGFNQWYDKQPDNNKHSATKEIEHCLATNTFGNKWFDEYCSQERPFICRDILDAVNYRNDDCPIELVNVYSK